MDDRDGGYDFVDPVDAEVARYRGHVLPALALPCAKDAVVEADALVWAAAEYGRGGLVVEARLDAVEVADLAPDDPVPRVPEPKFLAEDDLPGGAR